MGSRVGGGKPTLELNGKPLASYSIAVCREVFGTIAVVVKEREEAEGLEYDDLWLDQEEKRHPLVGVVAALEKCGADGVLICACDLPLVRKQSIEQLIKSAGSGQTTVASSSDKVQPLLGVYPKSCLEDLKEALAEDVSVTKAIDGLGADRVLLPDEELFNVNTPADIDRAQNILRQRDLS